jgi:pyridoxal phosphate enzyme (YggS family)
VQHMVVEGLPERVAQVRASIARAAERSGRAPAAVQLVAVSKTVPVAVIRQAMAAGVTDLGENRVQEAAEKIPLLRDQPVRWHLIGHLQANKVGKALQLFDVLQSVDTVELATLLSRRRSSPLPPVEVLFEVNVGGESTKQGFTPRQLVAAAPTLAALTGLRPRGLMTVAPAASDPEAVRPVFRRLRELRDALKDAFPQEFSELSMGMSHDFEVAIEEGATIVRVGTAIFGGRPGDWVSNRG